MGCISCGRGLEDECTNNCAATGQKVSAVSRLDDIEKDLLTALSKTDSGNKVGRPLKEDEEVLDPQSTGRKRAAILHPLDPNAFCEWRDKANCGGGKHPILGCASGFQRNIHHGPDKNTLNNNRSNIHKICPNCHNRWHAANDKDYDPKIQHSPRDANFAERFARLTEEMGDSK